MTRFNNSLIHRGKRKQMSSIMGVSVFKYPLSYCKRSFQQRELILKRLSTSNFFGGWFFLLPLGFWPQCDGCYSGGLGPGSSWLGCGLVGLWVFFRLGVYCGCSPLAHGHPTSTCDAGVNFTEFSVVTGSVQSGPWVWEVEPLIP